MLLILLCCVCMVFNCRRVFCFVWSLEVILNGCDKSADLGGSSFFWLALKVWSGVCFLLVWLICLKWDGFGFWFDITGKRWWRILGLLTLCGCLIVCSQVNFIYCTEEYRIEKYSNSIKTKHPHKPWKNKPNHTPIHKTATGHQTQKFLDPTKNYHKGSRQIRSLRSQEGLASIKTTHPTGIRLYK